MHGHRRLASSLSFAFLVLTLLAGLGFNRATYSSPAAGGTAPPLPQLPAQAWLNSTPLTLAELRGHPVLVEFWTFGCSNCRASLPWMKTIHARYARQGLQIIAVHSPELDYEHDPAAVARAVRDLGIGYPVLIDNGFRYWNALGNRFWPAFYLIDGEGRIVDTRIGELHTGERSSDEFELAIQRLLHEASAART